MTKLTAIIIDDEKSSRQILSTKIRQITDEIDIISEASNIKEGEKIIQENNPDIVFLDINMPKGSGFDLLDKFQDVTFEVIFVTAYNDFALKAFEYFAIGYILKPIDNEILKLTLEKIISRIKTRSSENQIDFLKKFISNSNTQVLAIPVESGFEFVNMDEIIRIESDEGYSCIHFENQTKILSSKPLNYYNSMLPVNYFYQIHRSHIINIRFLKNYHKIGFITLKNGEEIPVSKAKRSEFTKQFKLK